MKVIQLNEYVKLHDGEKIFFCKWGNPGYLDQACEDIKRKQHDVVLIIGGSDMCVSSYQLDSLPKNVSKVFVQNCHIEKDDCGDLIVPIPRGIEVSEAIKHDSHIYAWCGSEIEGEEKRKVLSNPPKKDATKFIYANFRVNTNPAHRQSVRSIAQNAPHITWREPYGATDKQRFLSGPPYIDFVHDILDHEAVVCAQGNDWGGNLRMYETLYLSRVALTFNPKMYNSLHYLLPVVLIGDLEELKDYKSLKEKIDLARRKFETGKHLLDFNYWEKLILEAAL